MSSSEANSEISSSSSTWKYSSASKSSSTPKNKTFLGSKVLVGFGVLVRAVPGQGYVFEMFQEGVRRWILVRHCRMVI